MEKSLVFCGKMSSFLWIIIIHKKKKRMNNLRRVWGEGSVILTLGAYHIRGSKTDRFFIYYGVFFYLNFLSEYTIKFLKRNKAK